MIPFFHLEDDFGFNHVKWVSEWLFFSTKWAMYSAISWREQVTFQWDNDVFRSVLGRQTREVDFKSVSSLKQQSTCRLVVPLGHSILIPSQLFFKYRARSRTYQFYSLWFDPSGNRSHDLPHLRRVHQTLHHRYGLIHVKSHPPSSLLLCGKSH